MSRWVFCLLIACGSRSDHAPARLWDDEVLARWGTPVVGGGRPGYRTSADYYAAPVDNLRTYPVYHPSREPAGYRASLIARGPQPLIEPAKLHTPADWIEAGRRVFEELDTPASRTADPEVIAHFTDATAVDKFRDASHDVMTADGILLDYRWVVGADGVLRISLSSCYGCHSRLMPDGSVLVGAPSNYDLSSAPAVGKMLAPLRVPSNASEGERFYFQFGVPWVAGDIHAAFRTKTDADVGTFFAQDTGSPPGTMFARVNGSPFFPTRMADLRGIKDRRFLDATATHENRSPEDVARYGILVEYAEIGKFGTHEIGKPPRLPLRPPDEAMLALARYLYSLEPARNPAPVDAALVKHGTDVFDDLDCAACHPAPLYTTNELVAVDGFTPPGDLPVSKERVGTDPAMALKTRKGTGYYRIPSLRGLWYRGLFEHGGSVTSLDEWFDRRRLSSDYVPSGFRGFGVTHRAVPGHEYGLDLDPDDKRALIAFLETL